MLCEVGSVLEACARVRRENMCARPGERWRSCDPEAHVDLDSGR